MAKIKGYERESIPAPPENAPLPASKANAVLISDGRKILVYPPRKLAGVQAILQHHGLCIK